MLSTRTETRPYLLDVNVLLALSISGHLHREAAVRWFDEHAAVGTWATTPLTEAGFVRLLLNERVYGSRLPPREAVNALAMLRAAPGWTFLADDATFARPSVDLTAMIGHRQVNDFHLLDLAVAHGHALVTLDRALQTYLAGDARGHVILVPVD